MLTYSQLDDSYPVWKLDWFCLNHLTRLGVTKPSSTGPLFFSFFSILQTSYLLNITFIFDRCNHGLSVLALIKYQCDLMNLISTFARLKISLTECFVNPATPERPHKPHNASAPCPTMRHSEQKYTYTVLNGVFWDLFVRFINACFLYVFPGVVEQRKTGGDGSAFDSRQVTHLCWGELWVLIGQETPCSPMGPKPSFKPLLTYFRSDITEQISVKFQLNFDEKFGVISSL